MGFVVGFIINSIVSLGSQIVGHTANAGLGVAGLVSDGVSAVGDWIFSDSSSDELEMEDLAGRSSVDVNEIDNVPEIIEVADLVLAGAGEYSQPDPEGLESDVKKGKSYLEGMEEKGWVDFAEGGGLKLDDGFIEHMADMKQNVGSYSKADLREAHGKTCETKKTLVAGEQASEYVWHGLRVGGDGKVVENEITPTSAVNKDTPETNHLNNFYFQVVDGRLSVTCGVIDTQLKADEFVACVQHAVDKAEVSKGSLRIAMHQLNSRLGEHKMIRNENHFTREINKQLKKVYDLGSDVVSHVNLSFNAMSTFRTESSSSRRQNVEGLVTRLEWMEKDLENVLLSDSNDEEQYFGNVLPPDIKKTIAKMKGRKLYILELKNEIDKYDASVKEGEKETAQNNLFDFYKKKHNKSANSMYCDETNVRAHVKDHLRNAQNALNKDLGKLSVQLSSLSFDEKNVKDPNNQAYLRAMALTLARQAGCLPKIGVKKYSRNTEIEVQLILDRCQGVVTQINCKSGIDRTGYVRSIDDALTTMQNYKGWDNQGLLIFVLNQDKAGSNLDKAQRRVAKEYGVNPGLRNEIIKRVNEEDSKDYKTAINYKDALEYRELVAYNLFNVAQPITVRSTGVPGLKYHQDVTGPFKGLRRNPHIRRIPMFAQNSEGKPIQLYERVKSLFSSEKHLGVTGRNPRVFTSAGNTLICGLSQKRGS